MRRRGQLGAALAVVVGARIALAPPVAPEPDPTAGEAVAVMLDHARRHLDWFGADGIRDFRKHTAWYLRGYPVGGWLRGRFAQVRSHDELLELAGEVDPTLTLPPGAVRIPRGHTGGPRPVTLPYGWLDDPDAPVEVGPEADHAVSGG